MFFGTGPVTDKSFTKSKLKVRLSSSQETHMFENDVNMYWAFGTLSFYQVSPIAKKEQSYNICFILTVLFCAQHEFKIYFQIFYLSQKSGFFPQQLPFTKLLMCGTSSLFASSLLHLLF